MSASDTIAIRSFRVCFRFERRIHKIDRWRVPLPFGVPLRGVAYTIALLVAILLLRPVPLLGAALWALPLPLRLVVLPLGAAYLLLMWEPDGRSAHALAGAWLRMRCAPRHMIAFRAVRPEGPVCLANVTIASDESSARLRSAVVRGPATVVLRYPFAATPRGRTLDVVGQAGPARWRGKQVELVAGQRMVIR
jgi:hypothetical protein